VESIFFSSYLGEEPLFGSLPELRYSLSRFPSFKHLRPGGAPFLFLGDLSLFFSSVFKRKVFRAPPASFTTTPVLLPPSSQTNPLPPSYFIFLTQVAFSFQGSPLPTTTRFSHERFSGAALNFPCSTNVLIPSRRYMFPLCRTLILQ